MRSARNQNSVELPYRTRLTVRAHTAWRSLVVLSGWLIAIPSWSMDGHDARMDEPPRWRPDATFAQVGGGSSTDSWWMGAQWDWHRQWRFGETLLVSGRWEVSVARLRALANWRNDDDVWYTSVGFTPMVRLTSERHPHWYVEAGSGPAVLLPVYVSRERTFSTQFNFDSRIAAGVTVGRRAQHDLAICTNHFSNANLKQPNPGLDQYSVRYTHRF